MASQFSSIGFFDPPLPYSDDPFLHILKHWPDDVNQMARPQARTFWKTNETQVFALKRIQKLAWCHEHHCLRKGENQCISELNDSEPDIFRMALIPMTSETNLRREFKTSEPANAWIALEELQCFYLDMNKYHEIVLVRDKLQKLFVADMKEKWENCELYMPFLRPFLDGLEDRFNKLNVAAAYYHYCLQRLAKHCYELLCNMLLQELHNAGRLQSIQKMGHRSDNNQTCSDEYLIEQYNLFRTDNITMGEVHNQPSHNVNFWNQFIVHINTISDRFLSFVEAIKSAFGNHETIMIDLGYGQDVRQLLLNVGFQPIQRTYNSPGRHSLVSFSRVNVGDALEQYKNSRADKDKIQRGAETQSVNN